MGPIEDHNRWSQKLEYVLEDRNALEAFIKWMKSESSLAEHPIRLHFAIIAYRDMCAKKHARTVELGKNLHQTYVSLKTGLCTFLPEELRNEISARVHSLSPTDPDPTVFDGLLPHIDHFLRKQHAQFVSSEEFFELYNQVEDTSLKPPRIPLFPGGFRMKPRKSSSTHQQPTLTAEMLLKTQHVRENTLGESEVEKLYPPIVKMPYVCNATTSKNDSAVSSTFSSDANNQNAVVKLSTIKEEQLRGNPATLTLARVEKLDGLSNFNHSSDDGRRAFAAAVIEKLNVLYAHQKRNDTTCQQLHNIDSRKCSAREVVVNSVEPSVAEDDDELDRYLKEKMADDSSKPSPSYHSPDPNNVHSSRYRRKAKWSSPDRGQYNVVAPGMNSSYVGNPYGSNGFMPPSHGKHGRNQNANNSLKNFSRERYDAPSSFAANDTSGVESLGPGTVQNVDLFHRAAVFQKARMLSSSNRKCAHRHHDFNSLPRMKGDGKPLLTISYKGKGQVPVVAHVPATSITFREFRKSLGISSRSNMQFFFKCACEVGSEPYQLLLVNDDSAVLPIYEGRVTAECKTLSDSD